MPIIFIPDDESDVEFPSISRLLALFSSPLLALLFAVSPHCLLGVSVLFFFFFLTARTLGPKMRRRIEVHMTKVKLDK